MSKYIKRNIVCAVAVLMFALLLSSCGNSNKTDGAPEEMSEAQKLEDINYFYDSMMNNDPFIGTDAQAVIDWESEKESFIESIKKDQGFDALIVDALVRLENDNIQVLNHAYLIGLYEHYTRPENAQAFERWANVVQSESVMKGYGLTSEDLTPGTELVGQARLKNKPTFRTNIVVPDKVAYLKIEDLMVGKQELADEVTKVRTFLEEVRTYEKIIIDIRGISYGNDVFWQSAFVEPLIKESLSVDQYFFLRGQFAKDFFDNAHEILPVSQLENETLTAFPEVVQNEFEFYGINTLKVEPKDTLDFNGEVYLIIDETVYASAERFASFAKESGFATLVGVSTMKNAPSENPLLLSLPNSGYVVSFGAELIMNNDGTIRSYVGIAPHIEIADHNVRVDTVDKAISYIKDL